VEFGEVCQAPLEDLLRGEGCQVRIYAGEVGGGERELEGLREGGGGNRDRHRETGSTRGKESDDMVVESWPFNTTTMACFSQNHRGISYFMCRLLISHQ
jgi:hypothetical protein